jgi:hypothetical protein
MAKWDENHLFPENKSGILIRRKGASLPDQERGPSVSLSKFARNWLAVATLCDGSHPDTIPSEHQRQLAQSSRATV